MAACLTAGMSPASRPHSLWLGGACRRMRWQQWDAEAVTLALKPKAFPSAAVHHGRSPWRRPAEDQQSVGDYEHSTAARATPSCEAAVPRLSHGVPLISACPACCRVPCRRVSCVGASRGVHQSRRTRARCVQVLRPALHPRAQALRQKRQTERSYCDTIELTKATFVLMMVRRTEQRDEIGESMYNALIYTAIVTAQERTSRARTNHES